MVEKLHFLINHGVLFQKAKMSRKNVFIDQSIIFRLVLNSEGV